MFATIRRYKICLSIVTICDIVLLLNLSNYSFSQNLYSFSSTGISAGRLYESKDRPEVAAQLLL